MRWSWALAALCVAAAPAAAGGSESWSAGLSLESIRAAAPEVPVIGDLAAAPRPRPAAEPGFCQKSWEESPGTTDYTVFDRALGKPAASHDRSARWTLLENPDHKGRSFCERAKFLKPCFDKALGSGEPAAKFQDWAKKRKLDPARVLLALAAQETEFGTTPDKCRRGNCNGVGLMQVITAIGPDGRALKDDDPRWDGITFNILTNIGYAIRIALDKVPGAENVAAFARRYNASKTADDYARKVQAYYVRLSACR